MMTRQTNKRRRVACVFLALAAFSISTIVLGDARTAELRELRQKEIANKPKVERDRLERNFKRFRELPVAEQERLRLLEMELKEDARNGGNLRFVMDTYYEWMVTTLTPGQQQELRQLSDPNRREKKVREFLKEQQDQVESIGPGNGAKSPPKLSPDDLASVLKVIETALREKHVLTPQEIQELDSKKELAHQAYVLELAWRRSGPQSLTTWNSQAVFDATVEAIRNEKQAKRIQSAQTPQERRQRLYRAIFGGLRAQYEKMKPTQEKLELFFVQLKPHQQDEIMRLPFDQQPQQLMHIYMARMAEEDPNNYPRLPSMPPWMRGVRGGARPSARPGEQQRGSAGEAPRRSGGADKNSRLQK